MTGFEPAASSSRTKRATGLRYIPLGKVNKCKIPRNFFQNLWAGFRACGFAAQSLFLTPEQALADH